MVERNATFPGSIGDPVGPIIPAVLKAKGQPGDLLDNAVRENVRRVVGRLHEVGPILPEAERAGKLKIVGARCDLVEGSAEFLD